MITDINAVKEILDIDNETFDARIARFLPYCEQVYKNIRGAPWDTVDLEVVYPVGSDITIANMIGYLLHTKSGEANITGEDFNSYSVSYDPGTINGFPRSIVGGIKKYIGGF